jgi:hypothetical protein
LFNLLLGDIRLPKLKLISEQKAENISVAPPYCQRNVSGSYSSLDCSIKKSNKFFFSSFVGIA